MPPKDDLLRCGECLMSVQLRRWYLSTAACNQMVVWSRFRSDCIGSTALSFCFVVFSESADDSICLENALGVWSCNEVARVDFKDRRVFGPCLAYDLVGRSRAESLEVPGEVVGGDKGQGLGLDAFQVVVGELQDPVDGQKHHQLAISVTYSQLSMWT